MYDSIWLGQLMVSTESYIFTTYQYVYKVNPSFLSPARWSQCFCMTGRLQSVDSSSRDVTAMSWAPTMEIRILSGLSFEYKSASTTQDRSKCPRTTVEHFGKGYSYMRLHSEAEWHQMLDMTGLCIPAIAASSGGWGRWITGSMSTGETQRSCLIIN